MIAEEVNVKKVVHEHETDRRVQLDKHITPVLRREGMAREVIRNVQSSRKKAGLNVDDRIKLSFSTVDDELRKAIREHQDAIAVETLAAEVISDTSLKYESSFTIHDAPLTLALEKAA